jgi:hypothetical protein
MKLGMYIMAPEQRLGSHVHAATNTRNNRGGVVFYTIHVLSKENLWVFFCSPVVASQRLGLHVSPATKNFFLIPFLLASCSNTLSK